MWPMFKIEMITCHSNAKLDIVKILFGKFIHLVATEQPLKHSHRLLTYFAITDCAGSLFLGHLVEHAQFPKTKFYRHKQGISMMSNG